MDTIAIVMMVLFIAVIWGGFALSLYTLNRHPDESSGLLGQRQDATDEILSAQEWDEPRVVRKTIQTPEDAPAAQ